MLWSFADVFCHVLFVLGRLGFVLRVLFQDKSFEWLRWFLLYFFDRVLYVLIYVLTERLLVESVVEPSATLILVCRSPWPQVFVYGHTLGLLLEGYVWLDVRLLNRNLLSIVEVANLSLLSICLLLR